MIDILIALAVVGAIGLIAGILLVLVSHLFHVEENETAKRLRDCLPGINCGACGFKGCDDYAAAMAEGGVKTNLCIPGAESVAAELSDILGVVAEKTEAKVAFCHCNGNCEATSKKATYEGVLSCRAAAMLYGGPDACEYGCLGFGDCAAVCPNDAICIMDGIAHIDSGKCVGCGLCSSVCPKSIISIVPKQTGVTVVMCNNQNRGAEAKKACQNACIGCKKCEKSCSAGAITVEGNLARIDYTKCDGCGVCVQSCPAKCLKTIELSEPVAAQL